MDCLVNSSSFLDNVLWVAPVNKQDGRRGPETQKLPKRYCFWGKISQLSTFNTRWTGEINTSSIYFVYTYLLFSTSFGFGFGFGFAKTLRFRFRFHRNPKNGFCWPLLPLIYNSLTNSVENFFSEKQSIFSLSWHATCWMTYVFLKPNWKTLQFVLLRVVVDELGLFQ